nr:UvrD-helicase domain-containing protein [Pontibacter russatus]
MPSIFKIYSSSAGSGKTYHLTKEYLKLALHTPDPGYYRSILAITFTNDAAAEMKDRILAALRNFNDDTLPEKDRAKARIAARHHSRPAGGIPGGQLDVAEVRRRAAALFRQIRTTTAISPSAPSTPSSTNRAGFYPRA